jgi:hypothetical protein
VTCGRWWFSLVTLVFFTNKTDCHDITEILLKVTLNTITLTTIFTKKELMVKKTYQYGNGVRTCITNSDFQSSKNISLVTEQGKRA